MSSSLFVCQVLDCCLPGDDAVHDSSGSDSTESGSSSSDLHTTSTSTDALYRNARLTKPPSETYLSIWKVSHQPLHHIHITSEAHFSLSRTYTSSRSAIAELRNSGEFSDMDLQTDEDEHSIEMHLPYVRKVFEGFVHTSSLTSLVQALSGMLLILDRAMLVRLDIKIVPVLVGAIDKEKEVAFGRTLAPYLARDDTFCVVSSDFCHWYVFYPTSTKFAC